MNYNIVKRFALFLFITAFLPSFYLTANAEETKSARVLLLNSYHQGYRWTDDIVAGIKSAMNRNVDFRIEYMDTRRIFTGEYLKKYAETFLIKHKDQRYDVIILSDNPALEFVIDRRDELFPGTPVVFCGINNFTDAMLYGKNLYTGVAETIDIKSTLEIAHRLHPAARKIIAPVNSNATGRANRHLLEQIMPLFAGVWELEIIEDPELNSFLKRITHLPAEQYIILLTGRFKNEKGAAIDLTESTPQIAAAGIPVYSLWDFYLGHGIVGGKLTNGFHQGKTAGEIARRILSGEKNVPIIRESPNLYMFDFTVLKKLEIDERALPPESIIINKPLPFHIRHRNAVIVAAFLIVLFSVITLFLLNLLRKKNKAEKKLHLYQKNLEAMVTEQTSDLNTANSALRDEIAERRQAEEMLRSGEKQLRTVLEASSETVFLMDKQGKILLANKTAADRLNTDPESLKQGTIYDFLPADVAESRRKVVAQVLETGKPLRFEDSRADKTFFNSIYPILDKEGRVSQLAVYGLDITRRKKIEEMLRESEERYRNLFENNHAVQLVIDPETGRIIDANPAACLYYGYDRKVIKTMQITDINTLNTEDIFAEMASARSEERHHFFFFHRLASGEVRPVEVYSGPIQLSGKKMLYSIVHDISDRRKAEEEKEKLILELKDALQKIKKLSGLLPICSSCKKIRDDKGYWNQIESFLKEHSEAEFTHSICPDCLKRLYPEFKGKE